MKKQLPIAVAILLILDVPGFSHRLNEYLQATMISMHNHRVQFSMRLVPGVAVLPMVLQTIDTNRDGVISKSEGETYARKVLRDLSLVVDDHTLAPELRSFEFPSVNDMRQGLGEIHLEFFADLPGGGTTHKLILRNYHQQKISAYLVNCLVPEDKDIRTLAQIRNQNQSFYQLAYERVGAASDARSLRSRSPVRDLFGRMGGFLSMFRLGMQHIYAGTDHLLFLLTLLLPAPLFAFRSRWKGPTAIASSSKQILRVVTAFTLGHSLTLALAGLGLVLLPSRLVETLIAVSILISSIHALRPVFPGREAFLAVGFGLVHGLAFAATLGQLGLDLSARLANIFVFNLGIETLQLIVVAATMPSFVLLSRTPAYPLFRIGGALCAALVSSGWIVERLLNLHNPVDALLDGGLPQYGTWIAGFLFLVSLLCWCVSKLIADSSTPSCCLE